jgi:hypothetical protein
MLQNLQIFSKKPPMQSPLLVIEVLVEVLIDVPYN